MIRDVPGLAPHPPTPSPRTSRRTDILLAGLVLPAAGAGWWATVALLEIPQYILPTPAAVLGAAIENRQALTRDAVTTAWLAAAGLVLGIAAALPLGILIGQSTIARRTLLPALFAIQAVPKVALAPLVVVWLAFGPAPKIVLTIFVTFFPIIMATVVGVNSLDVGTARLAASMGCVRGRYLRLFVLPAAAPYAAAAVKTASTLAVAGTVVAEFIGSEAGLGNQLLAASGNQDSPLAFAIVLTIGIVGSLFYAATTLLTRAATWKLGPWHMREPT